MSVFTLLIFKASTCDRKGPEVERANVVVDSTFSPDAAELTSVTSLLRCLFLGHEGREGDSWSGGGRRAGRRAHRRQLL